VVPNWPNLARTAGLDLRRGEKALAHEPAVYAFLEQRVQTALAEVSPWEQVKRLVVLPKPFSVAEDEVTVSLKLRRGVITAHHRDEIEAMYADGLDGEIG
jgi:long-chain acyl-CoA synthetase